MYVDLYRQTKTLDLRDNAAILQIFANLIFILGKSDLECLVEFDIKSQT